MEQTIEESYRRLLRKYYKAQITVICQYSGDISGDWRNLRDSVQSCSREQLGENFDFGEDPWIYNSEEEWEKAHTQRRAEEIKEDDRIDLESQMEYEDTDV